MTRGAVTKPVSQRRGCAFGGGARAVERPTRDPKQYRFQRSLSLLLSDGRYVTRLSRRGTFRRSVSARAFVPQTVRAAQWHAGAPLAKTHTTRTFGGRPEQKVSRSLLCSGTRLDRRDAFNKRNRIIISFFLFRERARRDLKK